MGKSAEFHQAMVEGWADAKKAKEQRRAENRAKWSQRRDWSDDNQHKLTDEPDIASEPMIDDPDASPSLRELRKIMLSAGEPLHQRIDAAEAVLSFELAPGAAAGTDPEHVAALSYRFLRVVCDDPATPPALKLRALKSVAAVENARAAIRSSSASIAAKRELMVQLVNSERARCFRGAGKWPLPADTEWSLRVSDNWDWPQGWPWPGDWPIMDVAQKFEALPRAELEERQRLFRQRLQAVVARNRDDRWQDLLGDAAA